ncbi:MAG: hypothetical protein A2Y82_02565 [Candidatus Buchananbacteria bacterium RBG_13_36_9]|uniref:Uncharacterized protein n=1 Tax=Candidatus Buchananbacteria bacterium RBG_13_36_9 TaxID=1797530 RepID=A0A1G1XNV8_9BACT|nr:MAG: hypothetical protein A2Y82_02565 [Candidatus Buchananbacteria bacterium RBG_13_36_9]
MSVIPNEVRDLFVLPFQRDPSVPSGLRLLKQASACEGRMTWCGIAHLPPLAWPKRANQNTLIARIKKQRYYPLFFLVTFYIR